MKAYHVLNGFVARALRRTRIVVVSPYVRNIGNCAEEIFFAFVQARREGRRAVLLFPRPLFWRLRPEVANEALVDVESPYGAAARGWVGACAGGLLTTIFFFTAQIYLRLKTVAVRMPFAATRRFARGPNNVHFVIPTFGRRGLWQPDGTRAFSWPRARAMRWREQYSTPLPVRLCVAAQRTAEQARAAMNLPATAWFACLHVREAGFHGDWTAGAMRNCSIENYLPAITAITEAGGYVVRLGDATMTPLPPMMRVIDYARSTHKSPLMDLYLIAECRFYLGVNSGPLDVAWLFGKPVVLTNITEWSITFPRQRGDRAILKHVFSRSRGRFLTLQELLDEPYSAQAVRDLGGDYALVENTPAEIKAVVAEYLAHPDGLPLTPVQLAFNAGRIRQIERWLSDPDLRIVSDRRDDVVEKYRIAAHAEHSAGALGQRFVDEFWATRYTTDDVSSGLTMQTVS